MAGGIDRDIVAKAKAMDIVGVANKLCARVGVNLVKQTHELVGPCPGCGGHDRFGVNERKRLFICRSSGVGGDVIEMVSHALDLDFKDAVEWLVGVEKTLPAPKPRPEKTDLEGVDYRETERARAYDIWKRGGGIKATPVEIYLKARGVIAPPRAHLRAHSDLIYWQRNSAGQFVEIHKGWAMLAAITTPDMKFSGIHMTWIDIDNPGQKISLVDEQSGKPLPAKKVRGSKRQAKIFLGCGAGDADGKCSRLVVAEGNETGLSALVSEQGSPVSKITQYWGAIDLGHLAGKAKKTIAHPTLKKTDKNGREFPVSVQGPWPKIDTDRDLMPPDFINEIVILGDGDSEPFMTEQAILRAALRWYMPGREIRTPFADAGQDFNNYLFPEASSKMTSVLDPATP